MIDLFYKVKRNIANKFKFCLSKIKFMTAIRTACNNFTQNKKDLLG